MPAKKTASTPPTPTPAAIEPIARGEATRAKLIESAHSLFLKKGFHGTSMRQIAEATGLALGGIYNHFSDKEAIFAAVLDAYHPYHMLLPALEQVEGDTPETFIQNAAGIIRQGIEVARADLLPLLFMEVVEFQGKHIKKLGEQLIPAFAAVMQRFPSQRGQTRRLSPPVMMRTFVSLLIGFMITEMILENSALLPSTDVDWFDGMMDIYLYGVAAPQEA